MTKKRAALEVQFNWVFVMVAGALILVFFFGVIQKQRELSQAKIGNALLTNIESIATGAGAAKGTVQKVGLPNIGINFGCTAECLCAYSIEDVRKEYHDKIIFAPKLIKGSEMVLWTLDWKVPFRATNFVYITTANDKYFFVYDNPHSPLFKMLNRTIPTEVNAAFVHFSQYTNVKNQNYNSAKFIFVDTASQIPSNLGIDRSFRKADVSGLYINTGGDAFFYDKISKRSLEFVKKESSYFGEPSIYGAIFASDSDAYECNMITALGRLQNILDIYTARAEYLDDENNNLNFCIEGYSTGNLETLKGAAGTASNNLRSLKMLASSVSAVNTQNEALLVSSCPLLY